MVLGCNLLLKYLSTLLFKQLLYGKDLLIFTNVNISIVFALEAPFLTVKKVKL